MTAASLLRPHPRFAYADLQVHTAHGDGMSDARQTLDYVERCTDLALLAVTDHDDVRGALLTREEHARSRYSFDFVPGIEISTNAGHLLALFVEQPIRSFRPLEETCAAIHRAGGLVVIPHPFSAATRSIGQRALERVLKLADPEIAPDAIEVANPTIAGAITGNRPRQRNREGYGLAETGGSDAHFPEAIGSAATLFEIGTAQSATEALRTALLARTTTGELRRAPSLQSLGISRLAAQTVRGLAVTPRKVLGPQLRRVTSAWRTGAWLR